MTSHSTPRRLPAVLTVLLFVLVTSCGGLPKSYDAEARESELPVCNVLAREEVASFLEMDVARIHEGSTDQTIVHPEMHDLCIWAVVTSGTYGGSWDLRVYRHHPTRCRARGEPPDLGGAPTGATVESLSDWGDIDAWLVHWDRNTPDSRPGGPMTYSPAAKLSAQDDVQCVGVSWDSEALSGGLTPEQREKFLTLARVAFDRAGAMPPPTIPQPPTT